MALVTHTGFTRTGEPNITARSIGSVSDIKPLTN
jgi:hypothetical protein